MKYRLCDSCGTLTTTQDSKVLLDPKKGSPAHDGVNWLCFKCKKLESGGKP